MDIVLLAPRSGSRLRPLLAVSRRRLTVNMQAGAYLGDSMKRESIFRRALAIFGLTMLSFAADAQQGLVSRDIVDSPIPVRNDVAQPGREIVTCAPSTVVGPNKRFE